MDPIERDERLQLLELLTEQADLAIFFLDPDGVVESWSPAAERLKGYAAEEIIGQSFSRFYTQEAQEEGTPERLLEEARRNGRAHDENWRVRKDGTRFWADITITALRGRDGKLRGFAKITRDLTARRLAEEQVRVAKEELAITLQSIGDALMATDRHGRVTRMNPVAEALTGWKAADALGQPLETVFRIVNEESRATVENPVGRVLREGVVVGLANHTILISRDGKELPIADSAAPIRDAGNIVGVVLVFHDQTPERKVQEERVVRLAAEQASRVRDEFLAMLGHELRNPLAPIVTALRIMKLRDNGTFLKEREIIERQVQHMVRLVDDLLDVSRIAQGKVLLKKAPVDLSGVLHRAIDMAAPLFEKRRQHFALEAPGEPIWVLGDDARMVQIFVNLLNNAAKYTGIGGNIRVQARQEGDEVEIEVSDDGSGISPELMPRIFDLFTQGFQGADRSSGGLGIGLSVVRSLVELHGGKVTARSPGTGAGSTFTVRLPLMAEEASRESSSPAAAQAVPLRRKRRVLLVDDNEDALESLSELLSAAGHQVSIAEDGPRALKRIFEQPPEIAVLDVGLPVMDGYELARRIRAELGERAPKLVALTGYGQAVDRARSATAGFAVHLVKPVDPDHLLEAIDSL